MATFPGLKQYTFAGGELSPELSGRADIERRLQSCQTLQNFLVAPNGTAKNRPGTKLVREVHDSSVRSRLLPFIVRSGEAYAIEVGDQSVRFHTLGGTVTEELDTGTHNVGDNSAYLADGGATWTPDEWIGGTVYNITDGSSAIITDNTGQVVYGTLTGGQKNRWYVGDSYSLHLPYSIEAPWTESDIALLKYAQQNDVMIAVHSNYSPYELLRYGEASWAVRAFTVSRPINPPVDVTDDDNWDSPVADVTPARSWSWVVCGVDRNGIRSLPSEPYTKVAAVLYSTKTKPIISWGGAGSGSQPVSYDIFRGSEGVHGYVGSATTTQFTDEGRVPDFSDTPPEEYDPLTWFRSEAASGEDRTALFAITPPIVATKTETPEALDENYRVYYSVQMPPNDPPSSYGVAIRLGFEAREGPDPAVWVEYAEIEHINYSKSPKTIITVETVKANGLDADSEFRIVTKWENNGPSTVIPNVVAWIEGGTESEISTFPQSVGYYEQRLVFAGYTHNGQLLRFSRTGDYYNFDASIPARDDDRVELVIASRRLDEIRDIVPLGKLLCFTAGGEWVIGGAADGPLTPISYDVKPRTSHGTADTVQVLEVGNSVLFVTDRGRRVREFLLDDVAQPTEARDLTVFVDHYFRTATIREWGYADVPYQVVWGVRSDGVLCGMTYSRDQNINAWHRHMTGPLINGVCRDEFESVCCIPEGNETKVYVIVKRTIDGVTKRFVEVFDERYKTNVEDWTFLDSSLKYDGRDTTVDHEGLKAFQVLGTHSAGNGSDDLVDTGKGYSWVTNEWAGYTIWNWDHTESAVIVSNTADTIVADLSGAETWDTGDSYYIVPQYLAGETFRITTDTAGTFHILDIGKQFRLRDPDDPTIECKFEILTSISATVLIGRAVTAVPAALQGGTTYPDVGGLVATTDWARCVHSFDGLDHLEGETVGLLVEGNTHEDVVVSSGAITLGTGIFAAVATVGLRYNSDLQTLPLEDPRQASTRLAKKIITGVGIELDEALGLEFGHDLDNMRAVDPERDVSKDYETVDPANKFVVLPAEASYSRNVNVALRQAAPLPVTVSGVTVLVKVGGNAP